MKNQVSCALIDEYFVMNPQSAIQEQLDHQLRIQKEHIDLQIRVSDLSEKIIAASEVNLAVSICRFHFASFVFLQALQSSEEGRLDAESRWKMAQSEAEQSRIIAAKAKDQTIDLEGQVQSHFILVSMSPSSLKYRAGEESTGAFMQPKIIL
jgi:septum formation inhibitor MinC